MAKTKSASGRSDAKTGVGIKIVLILVALLCVAALVYTVCDATGVLSRSTVAMSVGEDEISALELNQYYAATRNSYLNSYGSMLQQYGYDVTSAAFDSTACLFDSSRTWKDYFMDSAKKSAEQVSVLCQQAEKEGFSCDPAAEVQAYVDSLKDAAEANDVSLNKYLTLAFGNGAKVADVKDYYTSRVIASQYMEHLTEGFGISEGDVDAYFKEHQDDYTVLSHARYDFTYDESTKSEAFANATELAASVAADGSNFDALAKTYNTSEAKETYLTETVVSAATDSVGEWLKADGRQAGDVEVLEDEENSQYTVVLYLDKHTDESYTVAVRHILFMASDDAAFAEAQTKAEDALAQWKAGEATEDSFGALAISLSEDTSAVNGGLIDHISEGEMVTAFNDWCFDAARKPGDTDIVKTEYGYHVIYFSENEGPAYLTTIRQTLEDQAFNSWYETASAEYSVQYNKLANVIG